MLIQLNDFWAAQAADIIAVIAHKSEKRVRAHVRDLGSIEVTIPSGETKFERADKLREIINVALAPPAITILDAFEGDGEPTGKMSEREARDTLIDALEPVVAMLPAVAELLRCDAFEETAAMLDLANEKSRAAIASVRKDMPP
jgi:hypothetical protein